MQAKSSSSEELDKLRKNLTEEKMKKEQAVNKLAEIMNRKEFRNQGNKKNQASATELKKKEKECRKLQQDLVMVGVRGDLSLSGSIIRKSRFILIKNGEL